MSSKNIKIGFVGCGNMGSAIARAVSSNSNTKLYISDPNIEKAITVSNEIDAEISDNITVCRTCDFVFLAIKPNLYSEVVTSLAEALDENPSCVLVSMAAGISLEALTSLVGQRKMIRIMPNTPVSVGKGMTLWCGNNMIGEEDKAAFVNIMNNSGRLDELSEKYIDAASALSGCGPAFVYMFGEALSDGAVACGLPRDKAMVYAAQMILGAAEMMLVSNKHPGELKDEVCSPGGSTIEGVRVLDERAFRGACVNAVIASYEKTRLLGK